MIGKAAFGGIQLIAAHAEIDHHAVNLLHAALGKQRTDIVKIALHGGKIARRAEPFRRRGKRVVVAVNAVQMTRSVQAAQNLRAVSAAAERSVYINAALTDVQHIHRGHEHDAHMFK